MSILPCQAHLTATNRFGLSRKCSRFHRAVHVLEWD